MMAQIIKTLNNFSEINLSANFLILEKSPLLIHGEKVAEDIDIFDREKYFIDDEIKHY